MSLKDFSRKFGVIDLSDGLPDRKSDDVAASLDLRLGLPIYEGKDISVEVMESVSVDLNAANINAAVRRVADSVEDHDVWYQFFCENPQLVIFVLTWF